MNTLPAVFKLDENDFNMYREFLFECLEYSLSASANYMHEPSEKSKTAFYNWAQTNNIYICNRNNRDIGFIVIATNTSETDPLNTVTFFVHPKVCKLATITVARAAAVLMYCELKSQQSTQFMVSTIHTLVYTVFASFFDLKSLKHGNMFYLSCEKSDRKMMNTLETNYEQDEIKTYFEMFNLQL